MLCLLSSSSSCSSAISVILSHSKIILCRPSFTLILSRSQSHHHQLVSNMSASLSYHAFTGNPSRLKTPKPNDPFSPTSAFQTLKTLLSTHSPELSSPNFKVLPFQKGRPLAGSSADADSGALNWHLGWLSLRECRNFLENSEENLNEDSFIYLGFMAEDDVVYWAIDLSEANGLVNVLGAKKFCFVELRTLMVATDWADARAMGELAIAGHAKALLEWHSSSRFCGYCGAKAVPTEAGRRKKCSNESCKRRVYPRVDPVAIMLVIDKENDRVLLSRQSRFVPRLWSCLAGFIEPGESLEEAVRRETFEETGVEVGDVVYHSSQPWPVGPSAIPCQLMMGVFAYAKSLEIDVDKEELEDAQWHSREDVKAALSCAEYKKAQRTAASKIDQICRGVEKGQNLSTDFNVESGELAPMFIPGPFAIAHHLISAWANQTAKVHGNKSGSSLSSL